MSKQIRLSIKRLKEILEYAENMDLDDEIILNYDERCKSITIYLNKRAWRIFKMFLRYGGR